MNIIKSIKKQLVECGLPHSYAYTGLHTITIGDISDGMVLRINNNKKYIAFYYYKLLEMQKSNDKCLNNDDITSVINDVIRVKRLYDNVS